MPETKAQSVAPSIVVNGATLTPAQAATVQAALAFFSTFLIDDGSGSDERGAEMTALHSKPLAEVQDLL